MINLSELPTKPGVYQYFDTKGQLIYIGKAKNLKKRVTSYFQKDHADVKTQALVQAIARMDYIITDTEVEALLLESRLIKQHKPKYNIDLKHNERYAYLVLTDEVYPRLLTARKKTGQGTYFGPFIDGSARALTQKTLQEIFQLRTCKTLPKTVCLQYHIGLCSGPCEGKVSKEQYDEQVAKAKKYLKGGADDIIESLQQEMRSFAKQQQFELAKTRKEQIAALEQLSLRQKVDTSKEFDQDVIGFTCDATRVAYFVFTIIRGTISKKDEYVFTRHDDLERTHEEFLVQYYTDKQPPREIILSEDFLQDESARLAFSQYLSMNLPYTVRLVVPQRGDNAGLLALAQTNATYALSGENPQLIALKEKLNLPSVPTNMECYDISNLRDDYIVGAKVHFTNGKPNKSQYRKFRIRWTKEQNDFAAMYEVIKRRFSHVVSGEEPAPDLVVIDGGKGQLGAAVQALQEHGLRIPIISLAKREEEIFFPGSSKPLSTKKDKDPAIRLLMHMRDETHRFVITYHRSLRDAKIDEN